MERSAGLCARAGSAVSTHLGVARRQTSPDASRVGVLSPDRATSGRAPGSVPELSTPITHQISPQRIRVDVDALMAAHSMTSPLGSPTYPGAHFATGALSQPSVTSPAVDEVRASAALSGLVTSAARSLASRPTAARTGRS
jgi:hypothetical protein